MKPLSQRRAFMGLMSVLATAFVIGIWQQRFSYQSDFLADLLKISIAIAISTALISFITWTLTHCKNDSIFRGALAGMLTALIIIPLPNLAWAFKTEFINAHHTDQYSVLAAAAVAALLSIETGLATFINMTKASLVAVVGSICVGAFVAYKLPNRTV